jgi:hypothetical protein
METSNTHSIFVRKHFVKRPFARSKKRRRDNIKKDNTYADSKDERWMELACDCVNLQVSILVTGADASGPASRTGNDLGSSNCVRL